MVLAPASNPDTVHCPASAVCDWPNRIKIKCELYENRKTWADFLVFRFLFAEFAGFGFGFGLLLADWLFAFNLSYVIICVYLFNDSRSERVNAPAWHHESKNRVIAQVPPS